jgi:hypothetical protein
MDTILAIDDIKYIGSYTTAALLSVGGDSTQ